MIVRRPQQKNTDPGPPDPSSVRKNFFTGAFFAKKSPSRMPEQSKPTAETGIGGAEMQILALGWRYPCRRPAYRR